MALYVVSTPIGNLKDLSFRALEVLKSVDLILAEDTRVTKKLLSHYGISKPMMRFDEKEEYRISDKTLSGLRRRIPRPKTLCEAQNKQL